MKKEEVLVVEERKQFQKTKENCDKGAIRSGSGNLKSESKGFFIVGSETYWMQLVKF